MRNSLVKTFRAVHWQRSCVILPRMVSGCGNWFQNPRRQRIHRLRSHREQVTANSLDKSYDLRFRSLGAALITSYLYCPEQEEAGLEKGLDVREVLFSNGPVQMRYLSSDGWDISCTGVGGVFAGVLGDTMRWSRWIQ